MNTKIKQSIAALMIAGVMTLPAFAAGEPGNVSNVQATSKGDTTLTVTWDEVLDANDEAVDNYRLYYGAASVQKAEAAQYDVYVDTADSATTYDLTGLTKGTTYYISVTAFDSGLESIEYSIEGSGTPGENAPQEENNGDIVAPTVLNVIAADQNHVLVGFSEPIKLPNTLPQAAFTIVEQNDPNTTLVVTHAEMYTDDVSGKTVILQTLTQSESTNYVMTAGSSVKDMAGNGIVEGSNDSGIFLGSNKASEMELKAAADEEGEVITAEDLLEDDNNTENNQATETEAENNTQSEAETDTQDNALQELDETAPEDIQNLTLAFKEQLEKFVVMMNWEASLNTAKDLADQILYQSTDGGVTYSEGKSLGITATNHDVMNLEGGQEYTFKITTKDETGNESLGMVKSIRLPQTGLGAGVLVLGSAFGANQMLKRRRKKYQEQA